MQFVKHIARETKAGYSLVEVLVVVTIMGILSSMGVAGLQSAIANARVKDAAVNTAAFLERVANESRQFSSPICLAIKGDSVTLLAIRTDALDCSPKNKRGAVVDSLIIESPLKFRKNSGTSCNAGTNGTIDLTSSANAVFKPRLGMTAVPPEGVVCIQYGNDQLYGLVRKTKTSNSVKAYWRAGSSAGDVGWLEL